MIVLEKAYAVDIVNEKDDWWFDNGVTRHVINSPEYFVTYKEFQSSTNIKTAGKEVLKALEKGTIQVKSFIPNHK
ncbi:unnamed protein product [Diabrotica balteata]|uniref:Retrovirus-related Pol polyprotein from transposon TNT 1-94-like beta-barrel domain-containing protein n=1 Tax=Diabrotica balteata TaxID=107213 RepID=A0A9N9XKB8_DIABA|nr:unnamed protein product [Diabrotica balteata]